MDVFTLVGKIALDGAEIADTQLKSLDARVQKNAKSFRTAGVALAGMGAAILGVVAITTKMAMETVESENLFAVAMGNMRDTAQTWSKELSDALGLNEFELRRNISTLYQMTSSMGLSEVGAYDMSKGLTELAYDMASFFNLSPEEAFDKLRAGITGEAEPLKRLGILIDETTIKTVAYTNGIAQQGEELTQQQKIQARYLAIMQQTSNAHGDMARTLDSPTNQLRVLRTQIEETSTKIGMNFLPILQKINSFIQPILTKVGDWIDKNPKLVQAISVAAVVVGVLSVAVGGLLLILPTLTAAVATLGVTASIALGGLPIIIGAVVAAGVLLWQNWDKVTAFLGRAWVNIKLYFLEGVRNILDSLSTFTQFIPGLNKIVDEAKKKLSEMIDAEKLNKEAIEASKVVEERTAALESHKGMLERVTSAVESNTEVTEDNTEAQKFNISTIIDKRIELDRLIAIGKEELELAKDRLENAEEAIKQYQYERSEAGKLRITTRDVTTALIAQGWTAEKLADLWGELGDDVNYADRYLKAANLTTQEATDILNLHTEAIDKTTDAYKAQGEAAEEARKKTQANIDALHAAIAGQTGAAKTSAIMEFQNRRREAAEAIVAESGGTMSDALRELGATIAPGIEFAHGGLITEPTLLTRLGDTRPYGIMAEKGPEWITPEGGVSSFKTANITIMLDGRVLAKVLGQPLVDEIRLKTGMKV